MQTDWLSSVHHWRKRELQSLECKLSNELWMRRSLYWNNDERRIHSWKWTCERSPSKERRIRLLETLQMQTWWRNQEPEDGYHWNLQRRCSVETSKWSSEDRTGRSGETDQSKKRVSANSYELTSDIPNKQLQWRQIKVTIAEYLINVFFIYQIIYCVSSFVTWGGETETGLANSSLS